MRIAYVTTYRATDIRNWSGTAYYIVRSLQEQSISIEFIDSLEQEYSQFFKFKKYLYQKLMKKEYLLNREVSVLKSYAKQVAKQLSKLKVDIVFSPSTVPIAYLECEQPIVFWTDSTFTGMIDFYFNNLCEETIKNGNRMEQAALQRCKFAIYSSDWAAKSAIEYYQIDPAKVKVIPFGANIDSDLKFREVNKLIEAKPSNRCKLLFIGVDWIRKGGYIALKVAEKLNQLGLETELILVGCQPLIDEPIPKFMKCLGFIDKGTEEGRKIITELLAESHFLILPSKAECYGLVLCEANAFGIPCLASNVGGIPTIIKDGVNGQLFSKDASIEEYCEYILHLFKNYHKYKEMAIYAFQEYQSRLNWLASGQAVKKLLLEIKNG